MKCFLITLIVSAGIGCAQTSANGASAVTPDNNTPSEKKVVLCRLESLTWNPQTEELTWVVSLRDADASDDQAAVQQKFSIHVDTAVMNFNGEERHFDPAEAKQVSALMDLISAYTVESTVWWSNGPDDKSKDEKSTPIDHSQKGKGTGATPKSAPVQRLPVAIRPSPAGANNWQPQLAQLPQ
jgi:hypothetical protein